MRSDSFFDVGGHSLLGTRLAASIREVFGIEITLSDVMRDPEFEAMSLKIEERLSGTSTAAESRKSAVANMHEEGL